MDGNPPATTLFGTHGRYVYIIYLHENKEPLKDQLNLGTYTFISWIRQGIQGSSGDFGFDDFFIGRRIGWDTKQLKATMESEGYGWYPPTKNLDLFKVLF